MGAGVSDNASCASSRKHIADIGLARAAVTGAGSMNLELQWTRANESLMIKALRPSSPERVLTAGQRCMQLSDFSIGLEFFMSGGRWRCTDIGGRTVVAIKLDQHDPSWYSGPPYAVVEHVLDEYDLEGCSLTPEGGDV